MFPVSHQLARGMWLLLATTPVNTAFSSLGAVPTYLMKKCVRETVVFKDLLMAQSIMTVIVEKHL